MNAFLSLLEKYNSKPCLEKGNLTTLQVNMGNLCNQTCSHCHIDASPDGTEIMTKEVVVDILSFLSRYEIKTLDITGGAPELNPYFDYFITSARSLVEKMIVRSNLTVFFEPGKEYLPQFFKDNRVHLICSLPCYLKENVDHQRGKGVFDKSLKALRILNDFGFSKKDNLSLDLVYNPTGANLPPEQFKLERDYRKRLKQNYGIDFNRLLTITNVPIKRFKEYLKSNGQYEKYCSLLRDNFNPLVLNNLMCRTFLSVGYDGKLYDCDFNQALDLVLENDKGNHLTIDKLDPKNLEGKEILIDEHCLSCAAGAGSSCQGVLAQSGDDAAEVSCDDKKEAVKDYYGKVLKNTKDLKTTACCSSEAMPAEHKKILSKIKPEILSKFYGCGSPLPPSLGGQVVLDLGCGTGRDVYLASYLVGQEGFVIGVDMTEQQLKIANKYRASQMRSFGFGKANVDFKKGYIEDLKSIGIEDNSVDIVISNCVINLSSDKEAVFKEIFRVLKPGGELYFADVFADRRVPDEIKNDPILYGECLGGALYLEDFRRMLKKIGCLDYRIVSSSKILPSNAEIEKKIGEIKFCSITIRAFKLNDLEDICEDYGQVAVYLGTIPECSSKFILDDHHVFITGKPMLVCGNTASMLSQTRYSKHFKITGGRSIHYGSFKCESPSSQDEGGSSFGGSCC